MLQVSVWAAWAISAALLAWMLWDFMSVNRKFTNDVLISSREGVDELFPDSDKTVSSSKGN